MKIVTIRTAELENRQGIEASEMPNRSGFAGANRFFACGRLAAVDFET